MTTYPLGKIAVAVPGTPVPLAAVFTPCHAILVAQAPANTGDAYLGTAALAVTTVASISAVTNANPGIITAASAPATGESVTLAGLTGGWTGLNGTRIATNLSPTTFSVPVNTTAFGALTATTPTWTGSGFLGVIKAFVAAAASGLTDLLELKSPGNLLNLADYSVDAAVAGEGLIVSYQQI